MDTLLTSSPFRATSPPSSWRPWPSSGHSGSSSDRMRRPQPHPRSQLSSKHNLIELVRAWVAATPRHCLPRVSQCGQEGSYSLDRRHPATLIAHCASSSPALPMSLALKQLLQHHPRSAHPSSSNPPSSSSPRPVPRHPRVPQIAQCSPQSAASGFRLCQLVRPPPSVRFYACATTHSPSEPHIFRLLCSPSAPVHCSLTCLG